jgi:hypothetical protein
MVRGGLPKRQRGALLERRREWQRGAIVAAPSSASVAPTSDSSSSDRGGPGRQPWLPRSARPRWCARRTAPARPGGARVRQLQLGPGGARVRQLQLGPVVRARTGAMVAASSSAPWCARASDSSSSAPPGTPGKGAGPAREIRQCRASSERMAPVQPGERVPDARPRGANSAGPAGDARERRRSRPGNTPMPPGKAPVRRPFGAAAELAARRLSERRGGWQHGAFQNGGGIGRARPFRNGGGIGSARPWCGVHLGPWGAPGRRPSPRPAWAARRPSATAAELAARRPPQNGGANGSAAPSSRRPARPRGARGGQRQLCPGGAHAGKLQLGPMARARTAAMVAAPSSARVVGASDSSNSSPVVRALDSSSSSPVARTSDSSSSARWRAPGRQPWLPRPARPGGARVGRLQLGPGGARQDGSHRRRFQLGPVACARTAAIVAASSSARGRASDRSSSARWRARRTAPARPRWRAPGRQPSSPLPARPGGVRQDGSHRRRFQLGPWARVGPLQLGPVARASDGASSAQCCARRTAPARIGGARRTAPPGPVRVRTRRAAVVAVPRSAGGLASDSSNSAPVGRAA